MVPGTTGPSSANAPHLPPRHLFYDLSEPLCPGWRTNALKRVLTRAKRILGRCRTAQFQADHEQRERVHGCLTAECHHKVYRIALQQS